MSPSDPGGFGAWPTCLISVRLYSGINSWLVGRTGCPIKSEVQNSACGK